MSTVPGHECSCWREKRKAGYKGCHVQFIWVWRPQFVCYIFSVPRIQWKLVCIGRFLFAQKKKQHVWMIVYGLICTRKSYNMYKILLKKSWFVFYKKQYIVGEITWQKFTIHERHLRAQNGKIVDFNTESQNKFFYTPHMALTKEPIFNISEWLLQVTQLQYRGVRMVKNRTRLQVQRPKKCHAHLLIVTPRR